MELNWQKVEAWNTLGKAEPRTASKRLGKNCLKNGEIGNEIISFKYINQTNEKLTDTGKATRASQP